jgi:hypothetical protein
MRGGAWAGGYERMLAEQGGASGEHMRGRGTAASASAPRAQAGQGDTSDERVCRAGRSCQRERSACMGGAWTSSRERG